MPHFLSTSILGAVWEGGCTKNINVILWGLCSIHKSAYFSIVNRLQVAICCKQIYNIIMDITANSPIQVNGRASKEYIKGLGRTPHGVGTQQLTVLPIVLEIAASVRWPIHEGIKRRALGMMPHGLLSGSCRLQAAASTSWAAAASATTTRAIQTLPGISRNLPHGKVRTRATHPPLLSPAGSGRSGWRSLGSLTALEKPTTR